MTDVESLIEQITISIASMMSGETMEFQVDNVSSYLVAQRFIDPGRKVEVLWRVGGYTYYAFLSITKL